MPHSRDTGRAGSVIRRQGPFLGSVESGGTSEAPGAGNQEWPVVHELEDRVVQQNTG